MKDVAPWADGQQELIPLGEVLNEFEFLLNATLPGAKRDVTINPADHRHAVAVVDESEDKAKLVLTGAPLLNVVRDEEKEDVGAAKCRNGDFPRLISNFGLPARDDGLAQSNPDLAECKHCDGDIRPLDVGRPSAGPNPPKPIVPQFPAILFGCALLVAGYEIGSRGGSAWRVAGLVLAGLSFPSMLIGSWLVANWAGPLP